MKKTNAKAVRILVVEDEPVISRVCMRTLTEEGFDVGIATDGRIAEGMLAEKEYDLVLIDIRTPVMNGRQLYQSILERHHALVKGVIFTTGDILGDDNKSFLEQSGRLFLAKPFTPDELKAVVQEALAGIRK